jgi:hypothetical protein
MSSKFPRNSYSSGPAPQTKHTLNYPYQRQRCSDISVRMRRSLAPAAAGLGNMHQSGGCVDSTYACQQGRPVRSYAASTEQEGAVHFDQTAGSFNSSYIARAAAEVRWRLYAARPGVRWLVKPIIAAAFLVLCISFDLVCTNNNAGTGGTIA